MRLLLDEMLSPRIAVALRAHGHDAIAVKEHPRWHAHADPEILTLAIAQRRALVTANLRDFAPLHTEILTGGGDGHFGLVFIPSTFPLTRRATGRIVSALEALLAEYPRDADLADGIAWV